MEACASAHYWARELTKLGHEVRQLCHLFSIAAQFVLSLRQDPDKLFYQLISPAKM
jgi:transposase